MTDSLDTSESAKPQTNRRLASKPRWFAFAGVTAFVVAIVLLVAIIGTDDGDESRQEAIARRGAAVMPFDLGATRHEFIATATGGFQSVTANRADDVHQIELIREHLKREARRFRDGDFSDPGVIHGDDMPGLAALQQSRGRIAVQYAETPAGASIVYTTTDPTLRAALAAWIAAQNMDHGTGMHHA